MAQLTPVSKNHLDFFVHVHGSDRLVYGPAINSDCSSDLESWDLNLIDVNLVALHGAPILQQELGKLATVLDESQRQLGFSPTLEVGTGLLFEEP
jgi:hypothetical protein